MKSNTKKRSSIKIKKFADGGDTDNSIDYGKGISQIAPLLSGLVQSGQDPRRPSEVGGFGIGALSGAGTGASIGGTLGPEGALIGAGVGALVGGVSGIIGAGNQRRDLTNYNTSGIKNSRLQVQDQLTKTNINPYGTQMYAEGSIVDGGGKDPKNPNTPIVDNNVKKAWNDFQTYLQNKKIAGSPDLNTDSLLGVKHINDYRKLNPNTPLTPELVKPIQQSLNSYRQSLWAQVQAGKAVTDAKTIDHFMPNLSPTDGWLGVKTSQARFPNAIVNNKIVGLADANKTAVQTSIQAPQLNAKFADGGETQSNTINIEKGELQIDPQSGKVLRTYTGINPETGGLYEPHAKKEKNETSNNLVTADPGTFIITKALGKDYQKAIDENDKMKQNTILMNIKNSKDMKSLTPQFKFGSYVPSFPDGSYIPMSNGFGRQITPLDDPRYTGSAPIRSINDVQAPKLPMYTPSTTQSLSALQTLQNDQKPTILGQIGAYAPAITNLAQGIAGKIDSAPRTSYEANPYKAQILANMSKDINTDSIINEQYGQANAANQDIQNNSNNSSVARANRQQLVSNTQRGIAGTRLQGQIQNNQIAGQRAGIYGELGSQDRQEANRVSQLNMKASEQDIQSRAAKQNLFNTGISQLQQTQQGQHTNQILQDQDAYKMSLLKDLNPFAKYYTSLGGKDQYKYGSTVQFSTRRTKLKSK